MGKIIRVYCTNNTPFPCAWSMKDGDRGYLEFTEKDFEGNYAIICPDCGKGAIQRLTHL